MSLTTDPNDPCLINGQKEVGQNDCYLVLSEEERAKGFIRPYRSAYTHVGRLVESEEGIIEPLPKEEAKRYGDKNYTYFLRYPESRSPLVGKALTQEEVDNMGKHIGGCGTLTTMGRALSETYARDPKFYGGTYCTGCNKHLPVSEFKWDKDGQVVGS